MAAPHPEQHDIEFTPEMTAEELLDAVSRNGKAARLTKDGKPVARIERITSQCEEGTDRESTERAIAEIHDLRQGTSLGPDVTIRDLIGEGRE